MIDISGREFGIKLGLLLGIRIWIAFRLIFFCMVLLEQKTQWLPFNLRFLITPVHSEGLCSHGSWIWNYRFGCAISWTKTCKVHKRGLKKTGCQVPFTNATRGPEMISPNSFCVFIFTRPIDMNLDRPFLYNPLSQNVKTIWFINRKVLGARKFFKKTD